MNQRLCLAVVAILSSLSLAACTSLPTSSSPSPFDVDAPNAQPVDLAAGGPVAVIDAFRVSVFEGSKEYDTFGVESVE